MQGFPFVASWGGLDLQWHGKEYSESEVSRTAKSVHKGSPSHKLKRLWKKNASQEIAGPQHWDITLDNPAKHNALAGLTTRNQTIRLCVGAHLPRQRFRKNSRD